MEQFLAAINALPTAIFSGVLIVVILYWLLAALGQVDIDGLNVDVDADVDVGAPSGASLSAAGVLEWLSVGKVPLSLILSAWIIYSWMLCMLGEYLLRAPATTILPGWGYALAMGVAAPVAALFTTGYTVRPLRRVFDIADATTNEDLVGRAVTITSRTVEPTFGRAVAIVTGSEVILDVVCREGATLIRDDQAVVVEYLAERNVYVVAPMPHLAAGFAQETVPTTSDGAAEAPLSSSDSSDHTPPARETT